MYVRENTRKVMKDLRLRTSDGMDDWLWWSWRFLQCLEGDGTLRCWSKLLQFCRSESSRVYVSLCLFLCDVWSENVHLLRWYLQRENVYVIIDCVSNCLDYALCRPGGGHRRLNWFVIPYTLELLKEIQQTRLVTHTWKVGEQSSNIDHAFVC